MGLWAASVNVNVAYKLFVYFNYKISMSYVGAYAAGPAGIAVLLSEIKLKPTDLTKYVLEVIILYFEIIESSRL